MDMEAQEFDVIEVGGKAYIAFTDCEKMMNRMLTSCELLLSRAKDLKKQTLDMREKLEALFIKVQNL